jgi:hypothetical protein
MESRFFTTLYLQEEKSGIFHSIVGKNSLWKSSDKMLKYCLLGVGRRDRRVKGEGGDFFTWFHFIQYFFQHCFICDP